MNYEWGPLSLLFPSQGMHLYAKTLTASRGLPGTKSIETARILVGQELEIIFNSKHKTHE